MGFSDEDLCAWLKEETLDLVRRIPLARRYSQHLMVDCRLGNLFAEVLSRLGVETAVELGAGPGLLTRFISRVTRHLVAVELDFRFLQLGSRVAGKEFNVEYLLGDGLKLLERGTLRVDAVVSNTPYSITGPFIASIIKSNIPYALITLQREVGERLVAAPGGRRYGSVTVLTKRYMKPEIVGYISPESFYPPPRVWSAVVLLKRHREWVEGDELFEELLRCVFNQRRKKALKVVNACLSKISAAVPRYEALRALLGEKRVHQMSVEDFNNLMEVLTK